MNPFKYWRTLSLARRASIKRKTATSAFLSTATTFFVLGHEYGQEIVDYWNTDTGKMVMIPSGILVFLALLCWFLGRKLTAPMRRKKELQNLQLEKERKEVEKLNEEMKEKEKESEQQEEAN